jgi:hypothetical protein
MGMQSEDQVPRRELVAGTVVLSAMAPALLAAGAKLPCLPATSAGAFASLDADRPPLRTSVTLLYAVNEKARRAKRDPDQKSRL